MDDECFDPRKKRNRRREILFEMSQAPQYSGPPLPEGWEARFDPAKQRFFFVDHVKKTTSWDAPASAGAGPPLRPSSKPAQSNQVLVSICSKQRQLKRRTERELNRKLAGSGAGC